MSKPSQATAAPRRLSIGGTLTALLLATPLPAVPAVAQESEQSARAIEEVVVTARRRTETIQDVPVAITAFSGDELAAVGAQDITYLNQSTPNVTIERTRSTNHTLSAFIRGVGQQDPVAGFEPGVGIYLDDVYLNRPQGAVLEIYDVERVEVLRGPQGTLYGRNTIGGAVKYVTRRLAAEPEAKLEITAGSYDQLDVVGTFSLPLSDQLAVGASVAQFRRDGFGENRVQQGVENYDKDMQAARVSLEWTPSDAVFVRLSGDYTDDDSDPRNGHRLIDARRSATFRCSTTCSTPARISTIRSPAPSARALPRWWNGRSPISSW